MGISADSGLMKTARALRNAGLHPRIRIYRKSANGLRMRVVREVSVEDIELSGSGDIVTYAFKTLDIGYYYCAKLFSTKYGRNILECRHDFGIGDIDIEDDDF